MPAISQERPDSIDAIALIDEIVRDVASAYPPESRHGLSAEQLIAEGAAFFIMRIDGAPAGCGGAKLYGTEYAEVKRLYVRPVYRKQGLGKLILGHLEAYALGQGIRVIRLQTGIYQREAMGLYERSGYRQIPPFGAYKEDPMNRFYEKHIV